MDNEVQTTQLTKDLRELLTKLFPFRNNWFNIGIQLRVETEKLKDIRRLYPECQDGLREMLIHRLKQHLLYEELEAALKSPLVDPVVKPRHPSEDKDMEVKLDKMQKLPTFANNEEADYTFKIITVGDAGVGKTSLLQRFAKASSEVTVPTMALGELCRVVGVNTGQRLKLILWDTAGGENLFMMSVPELYFRNADAVLVVFDVTSKKSFDHAVKERNSERVEFKTWLKEVRYRYDDANPPLIFLVGNKNDNKEREVDFQEAKQLARASGFDYIETSSLEDTNVDQLFFLVCLRLLEEKQGSTSSPKPIVVAPQVFSITSEDQNSAKRSVSNSRSRRMECCC